MAPVGRPAGNGPLRGDGGYIVIEGWDVFDAFYMTITTVTTVGYGEIHPLSRTGRLFNSGVIILGVATVLYTFSFLMARLVEGDLQARWARRRRERMLDDLTNHFIICGFGRIGQIVAREFARQSIPFVIIERDAERVQAAIDRVILPSKQMRAARMCCGAFHQSGAGVHCGRQYRCR